MSSNSVITRLPYLGALRRIAISCAMVLSMMSVASHVFAQDNTPIITAPENISLSSIEQARERIKDRTDLNETQLTAAKASYDTAETAFKSAQGHLEEVKRLNSILVNGPKRLEDIRAEIAKLQGLPPIDMDSEAETMTAAKLADSQQSLIAKEAEQRALRAQITDHRTEIETLQSRRILAPKEQTEALAKINSLSEQIVARGDGGQGPVDVAQTIALKSSLYFRRAQAAALELEIASFADSQKLILAKRDLTQAQLNRVSEEVTALQRLTGQQRKIDARRVVAGAEAALNKITTSAAESGNTPHPLLLSYAQENLSLANRLTVIAQDARDFPGRQAQKRSQIDILEADLTTAQSLIALGNLSRQSATTLRQLRNDNESVDQVETEIKGLNQDIAIATQNRLLAQNRIRQLSTGETALALLVNDWAIENPLAPPLDASDISALQELHNQRGIILTEVTNAARDRLENLLQLKNVLDSLLEKSRELTRVLDKNLLWLPSIAAIDFSWPEKVVKGAAAVFSPRRLGIAWSSLIDSVKTNLVLVFVFLLAAGGCLAMRERLWADIERRAAFVGRVQKDSYLHTPAVTLACIIIAMPLPMMFVLLGILFDLSPSIDPFIGNLSDTAYYLAIFTGFFLTWRAWDGDMSLFDKHFKLGADLRHAINRQLRWFIPVTATSTALIGLTFDSKDPNVFEGFSLAAFLVTTVAITFISYQILWKRRHEKDRILRESENLLRYRGIFAIIMMGVPFFCAVFASLGYYETTSQLLYRLFVSGWLLIGTYVVYGTTRRTVVVSKRRIALKQAIERRDKAVKARQEQKEAEDRGEDIAPPPAVNYEEIDIETVSRQTEKLLNAFMLVMFAVLMWTIWSDLLPALSFFDNVELGHYMVDTMDPATNLPVTIERAITLWNVMQALVIIILTVMAARNLPGFLEVFALNRLGFDAGTRYAIVTILGYIIFGFGLFMGLDRLGLQWSQLKWVITGLSVGIGLGLQKIIANFVSGLIILFERPVRLGDYVTIGEQSGNVTRIQIRATTLVDLDNREIIIPNEALISERVTNWTLSNSITRLVVNVGVAYGTDTDRAKAIMMDVAKANPLVLDTPAPQVIFSGFGDSSLDFEVRTFLKSFEERVPTRHALHTEINKAFEDAGIVIPFPQRDLHIIPRQPSPIRVREAGALNKDGLPIGLEDPSEYDDGSE